MSPDKAKLEKDMKPADREALRSPDIRVELLRLNNVVVQKSPDTPATSLEKARYAHLGEMMAAEVCPKPVLSSLPSITRFPTGSDVTLQRTRKE